MVGPSASSEAVIASNGPILVPVDFSIHSKKALIFAAHLSRGLDRPLLILHVINDPAEAPGTYSEPNKNHRLRKMEDVAKEMLQKFVDDARASKPQDAALANAQTMLVSGIPVTRILEIVDKVKASHVVMGSQGRTGLARVLMGSKATQVTGLCPVPVTIVKAGKA